MIVDNNYVFPEILSSDKLGRTRKWEIRVRLIKTKKDFTEIDWPEMEEPELPLLAGYIDGSKPLPKNCFAQYWVVHGILDTVDDDDKKSEKKTKEKTKEKKRSKLTRCAPTYPEPKNVGRANERNRLQQAIFEAEREHTKKLERYGQPAESPDLKHPLLYPMRATDRKKITADKTTGKKYSYPIYVQPKLDGERRVAFRMTGGDVVMYTRDFKMTSESPTILRIYEELKPIFAALDSRIYLDGELYVHGLQMQDIHSLASAGNADGRLEYHIYDCFRPDRPKDTFEERWAYLSEFKDGDYVKFVTTHLVADEREEDRLFEMYISKKLKYEGIMLRVLPNLYTFGTVKEQCRSRQLLKRKPNVDEEFEVVDYTSGKNGRATDALIWICQLPDGTTFKATPLGSTEDRRALFRECESAFDEKYKGRMLKVQFTGKSKKGVPKTAYSAGFRDYM